MSRPARPLEKPGKVGRSDLIAGVSVALVLIPQSLAYAVIAGVPPHVGLLAAALPTIVAAPFASSRYLQTGPVAMTALLTFGALAGLATPFGADYVALAALLAIVVGVVRILTGLLRIGGVAHFMSRPVTVGFTVGATILIAASQLPTLFGLEASGDGLLQSAWLALIRPAQWDWSAVAFGVGSLATIELARRWDPRAPGILTAVVIAAAASSLLGYDGSVVGDIPASLPGLSLDLPWQSVPQLIVPGLVIAFVGFTEAAAISTVFAAEDRERWDANREFISQGAANLASGLSGGFPVGGSFSRSSINRLAGATSRWSGAITGLAVLAFIPLAGLLEPLPTSVLAAIVISGVARLIRPRGIMPIWRQSRLQGALAAITLVATLLLAPRIDLAVLIGIGLAILVHLRRELRLDVDVVVDGEVMTIAPRGVVFFGSTPALVDTLITNLAANPGLKRLVLDLGGVGRIDYTGGNALSTIILDSKAAGLEVEIRGTPPHAKRIIGAVIRETGGRSAS